MSLDYNEIICQAVDTIVSKRLEEVKFDQTILCTIIDNSKKSQGVYTVSNGSVSFEAYSTVTNYSEKTNVYVQIPNGDWNEQKIIIGKKTSKDETPFVYKEPFDDFVSFTDNLIKDKIKKTGLIANYDYNTGEKINGKKIWDSGEINLSGYTKIGIQADFQSWLKSFNVFYGNYGLALKIEYINESVIGEENIQETYAYLDTSSMTGNVYNFDSDYKQEIVYNISSYHKIKRMVLYFFEEAGSFKNAQEELIGYTDSLGNLLLENLYVSNVYVGLGCGIDEQIEDNALFISTTNESYSYDYKQSENDYDNYKQLRLVWQQRQENNQYGQIDENSDIEYQIMWYRYKLGASGDKYSGIYWIPISSQKASQGLDGEIEIKLEIYDEDLKNAVDLEGKPLKLAPFYSWLIPNASAQNEYVKAILIVGEETYESNTLTFPNSVNVTKTEILETQSTLIIDTDDGNHGNYYLYNYDNNIINNAQIAKERNFYLYFNSVLEGKTYLVNLAESIEWIIPAKNTMVEINIDEAELIDGEYHIIKTAIDSVEDVKLPFKIKKYYSSSYTNNMIKCKMVKDKMIYLTQFQLNFGIQYCQGNSYNLNLFFDEYALTIGESNKYQVVARLYDYENKEIDISNYNINWQLNNSLHVDLSDQSNNTVNIQLKLGSTNKVPTNNTTILSATINYNGNQIIGYLPIPIRLSRNFACFEGTEIITYDSSGFIHGYYSNPYKIYDNNFNQIDNLSWKSSNSNYKLNNNILAPINFYINNMDNNFCIYASQNGNVVWSQPVLVLKNEYLSKIQNENFNGLIVNNKKLLAAKTGSGNIVNNKFTGLAIGTYDNQFGIYLFNDDQQIFKVSDDGTFLLGNTDSISYSNNELKISIGNTTIDKNGITSNDYNIKNNDSIITLITNLQEKINSLEERLSILEKKG